MRTRRATSRAEVGVRRRFRGALAAQRSRTRLRPLRSHTKTRRRLVVTALVTGAAMVVGVAFAAWVADGTGYGSARARVAEPLTTLDASASATPDLYPGGTGDLVLQIANPNPYPVVVSSVTGNGEITSDTSGCDATNHAVTFSDQSGLALAVPGGGSATHVLADAVAMGTSAADACQGAMFHVPIAISGYSGTDGGGDPGPTPYYTGPAGTEGVGECRAGTMDSDGNVVEPEVTPEPEVDDGLDNDCDGEVDEGTQVSCDDGDPSTIDTYDATTDSCSHTPDPTIDADEDGYTIEDGDCDDANASINPGATEVVDGVDNNCDGSIDEG